MWLPTSPILLPQAPQLTQQCQSAEAESSGGGHSGGGGGGGGELYGLHQASLSHHSTRGGAHSADPAAIRVRAVWQVGGCSNCCPEIWSQPLEHATVVTHPFFPPPGEQSGGNSAGNSVGTASGSGSGVDINVPGGRQASAAALKLWSWGNAAGAEDDEGGHDVGMMAGDGGAMHGVLGDGWGLRGPGDLDCCDEDGGGEDDCDGEAGFALNGHSGFPRSGSGLGAPLHHHGQGMGMSGVGSMAPPHLDMSAMNPYPDMTNHNSITPPHLVPSAFTDAAAGVDSMHTGDGGMQPYHHQAQQQPQCGDPGHVAEQQGMGGENE